MVLHSVWDGGTDVAWANNSHSEVQYMYFPKLIDHTDKQVFRNVIQWCYRIINTANMVITRSENEGVNWKGASDAENQRKKNEVVAEAKLFRAWAYRHLTLTYGDVPLSTEEITGLNYRTDWERNPVSEIRQVMEEDLKFAIENLPLRTANNSTVSGAMARHYLGELYLAEGKNAEAEAVIDVPPSSFIPQPNVGSAVVRLTKYPEPKVKVKDDKYLFEIIRTSFNQRRKTLSNSLSNNAALGVSRDKVTAALVKMGIDERARGETLTLEQFAELSDILQS